MRFATNCFTDLKDLKEEMNGGEKDITVHEKNQGFGKIVVKYLYLSTTGTTVVKEPSRCL